MGADEERFFPSAKHEKKEESRPFKSEPLSFSCFFMLPIAKVGLFS